MRIWPMLLGLGISFCVAWLFSLEGLIVLVVSAIVILAILEWQHRQKKRILKERLSIIMTMAEETQSMIDKAHSELEKTQSKIS